MGDRPPVTTVTERIVVDIFEDNQKKMASLGIANAYANPHNIYKLTETLEKFKGKMDKMKDVLRKEESVYRESKRKYEDTHSDYEKLQQYYQVLGEERHTLKQSNINLIKEKWGLENKIAELKAQNYVANRKTEQYEAQVAGLEARNNALDVLLKTTNEQKTNITPMTKQTLFLRNKIYQM